MQRNIGRNANISDAVSEMGVSQATEFRLYDVEGHSHKSMSKHPFSWVEISDTYFEAALFAAQTNAKGMQ